MKLLIAFFSMFSLQAQAKDFEMYQCDFKDSVLEYRDQLQFNDNETLTWIGFIGSQEVMAVGCAAFNIPFEKTKDGYIRFQGESHCHSDTGGPIDFKFHIENKTIEGSWKGIVKCQQVEI